MNRHIQVFHNSLDKAALGSIFLTKVGIGGLHDVEQFGHNRCHTLKVTRSSPALGNVIKTLWLLWFIEMKRINEHLDLIRELSRVTQPTWTET